MSKYPNLKNEKIIALDLETKDQYIKDLGPGYYRAKYEITDDKILTIGIATRDLKQWSFVYDHHTAQWLKDNLHLSIVGANVIYDLGWLMVQDDIIFNGNYYDILGNDIVLTGKEGFCNLDSLAKKYLNEAKGDDEIKNYCEEKGWKGDPRQYLYLLVEDVQKGLPLVLKYNASDAIQTMRILLEQTKNIPQDLMPVIKLENDFLKPLLDFKRNGIRVDQKKLETVIDSLNDKIITTQQKVSDIAGCEVNTGSAKQLAPIFDELGLSYVETEKGNPSFSEENIENMDHEFPKSILELRHLQKLQSTYFEGFSRFIVNGRVYADIHPLRNNNYGTETGRMSITKPALQTIPKRNLEAKKLARGIYIPEEGYIWESDDQSQEEYRIFAHYARGEGAEELRMQYINNPNMDMHTWTSQFIEGEDRDLAKKINFSGLYGAGVHKFARMLALPIPPPWPKEMFRPGIAYDDFLEVYLPHKDMMIAKYKAAQIYFGYHDTFKCIKETSKAATNICKERGYAKTLLGRRRYILAKDSHKALNTTIQGTAADIMKLWIVGCYNAGLQNILKFYLPVHDEFNYAKPPTTEGEEAAKEVKHIGETCLQLRVPLIVERKHGPNWADVEGVK